MASWAWEQATVRTGTPLGHLIEWLPKEVSAVWRAVLWAWMVLVVLRLADMAFRGGGLRSTVWLRLCAIVLIARTAVTQAYAWGAPTTYESLPVTTVALTCATMSIWEYGAPAEGRARRSTGTAARF